MKNLVRAKFVQNKELQMKLARTGDKNHAEATNDKYFGIGASLFSRAAKENTIWDGQNQLGVILKEIREDIVAQSS